MALRICWNGQPIGEVWPQGKTLDKVALRALSPTNRLRAYLAVVSPAARGGSTLARVCGIAIRDIPAFLRTDIRDGVITTEPGPSHDKRRSTRTLYRVVVQGQAAGGQDVVD